MTPELSRPIAPELVPATGQDIDITATPAECAALALRLGLPGVKSVRCTVHLQPGFGTVIHATGHLRAQLVQTCVVTLENFSAVLDERFAVRFVPQGRESFDADPESVDEIPYQTGHLDLGEAIAEQLALSLDPYHRRPGIVLPETEAGPQSPFAALAMLKFPRRAD